MEFLFIENSEFNIITTESCQELVTKPDLIQTLGYVVGNSPQPDENTTVEAVFWAFITTSNLQSRKVLFLVVNGGIQKPILGKNFTGVFS